MKWLSSVFDSDMFTVCLLFSGDQVFVVIQNREHGAQLFFSFWTGDAKSEDAAHKEAGEEKPEEDNDYHRSDEQVSPRSRDRQRVMLLLFCPQGHWSFIN